MSLQSKINSTIESLNGIRSKIAALSVASPEPILADSLTANPDDFLRIKASWERSEKTRIESIETYRELEQETIAILESQQSEFAEAKLKYQAILAEANGIADRMLPIWEQLRSDAVNLYRIGKDLAILHQQNFQATGFGDPNRFEISQFLFYKMVVKPAKDSLQIALDVDYGISAKLES